MFMTFSKTYLSSSLAKIKLVAILSRKWCNNHFIIIISYFRDFLQNVQSRTTIPAKTTSSFIANCDKPSFGTIRTMRSS